MMGRCNSDQVKLTHIPTGISVVVKCDWLRRMTANHPDVMKRARRWLASKLFAPTEPPRELRSYYLSPEFMVGIRQGKDVLVSGREAVNRAFDGDLPWIGPR